MVEELLMLEDQKAEKESLFNFIKNRSQYLEFYNSKKKVSSKYFLVLCLKDTESSFLSIGITVTKKIGNAVVRNKIKRRLKAYLRNELNNTQNGLMLNIVAIKDSSYIPWSDLKSDLDYLFKKINKSYR